MADIPMCMNSLGGFVLWLSLHVIVAPVGIARALEKPRPIPVGLDAYRLWDHGADQRIGMRSYMRSTYDRSGGNEGADASHFLYQLSDDFNVTLDLEGPGALIFSRYNHWHGSPWHYVVDGKDHLLQETSTRDPLHLAADSVFCLQNNFPIRSIGPGLRQKDLIWFGPRSPSRIALEWLTHGRTMGLVTTSTIGLCPERSSLIRFGV